MCQAARSAGAKVWRGDRASSTTAASASVAGCGERGHGRETGDGRRGQVRGRPQEHFGFFVSRIEATESFKQVCSFKITLAAGWRVACRVSHKEGTTGLYDVR